MKNWEKFSNITEENFDSQKFEHESALLDMAHSNGPYGVHLEEEAILLL